MNWKTGLAITLIVISLSFSQAVSTLAFGDIKGTTHEKAIVELHQRGIIGGYADGTFKPNAELTREHAVRLIGRVLIGQQVKVPEDAQQIARFEDILNSADEELKNVSALLYEEGVFLGSQGYLDLHAPMQRQHMAIVLTRVAKDFYNVDLQQLADEAKFKTSFTDLADLSNESVKAITSLQYADISIGQQFNPTKAVTRGEFASFLSRMLTYVEKLSAQQEAESNQSTDIGEVQESETIINKDPNADEKEGQAWVDVKAVEVQKGAPLFASRNELKQVGSWEASNVTVAAKYLAADNLFSIELGKEKFYVQPVNIVAKTALKGKKQPFVGAVRTKDEYTIWQSIGGDKFLTGTRATKLDVIELVGDYYRVELGERDGYIHRNETFVNVRKPLKLLETGVVFDTNTNTSYSSLHKGAVLQASWVNDRAVYFGGAGSSYSIENRGVVETEEEVSFLPIIYTMYPINLVSKEAAPIYNTKGIVIGELNANTSVVLKGIGNGKGVIDYAGQGAYVALHNFKHVDLVTPTRNMHHEEVDYYLQVLHYLYPHFTQLELLGKSVEGRNIHALKLGTGEKVIVLDASLHAREHMTTNVLMEMLDQYSLSFLTGSSIGAYNVNSLLSEVAIWFVPMVNPDGVTLVQKGLAGIQNKDQVLQMNGGSTNVSRWKANIRGVDLNRNFDARWYGLPKLYPSYDSYKGTAPFSEPESQALGQFLLKYPFKSYISFHSSGQVLYVAHETHSNPQNANLIEAVRRTTGYQPIREKANGATGASTNYFVIKTGKPELTVEIAPYAGYAPVSFAYWPDVWYRTHLLGLVAANEAKSR